MKSVLYYLISFMLLATIGGEIQAQNENAPVSVQDSSKILKRARKDREKPERALVKKTPVPSDKKIKVTGNWSSSAVAYDESDAKGTSISNPIEISSAEQLAYLAKQVNAGKNYAGKHFRLTADINLIGREWTPIGLPGTNDEDNSKRFCGFFYGDGHKVEYLTIAKGSDYLGLFGVCGTGAYIEKLNLSKCYIRGKMLIGGLVGELIDGSIVECSVMGDVIGTNECVGGIVGINNGSITNSHTTVSVFGNSNDTGGLVGANGDRTMGIVDNCYAEGEVVGYWNVGGLVGRNNGVITNSKATGNVIGEEWVGGLVGWADKGMITNCQASGKVRGFFDVGGLIGFNGYMKSTAQINNCFATGAVIGYGSGNYCIGGLAGYSGGIISDCYATGTVEGEETVGGLIGEHGGKLTRSHATGNIKGSFDVGGLIGFNGFPGSQTTVENCYATGTVTGYRVFNFGIGGLAGYSGGIITSCYATGAVSGEESVGGLVGEQGGTLFSSYATGNVSAKISAGGLVGWNWAKLNGCYAIGLVNCDGYAGGLVGQNQDADAVIKSCYFDWQTTRRGKGVGKNNNERSSLVIPKATDELTTGDLPEGFDETMWIPEKGSYPKLKAFNNNTTK